MPTLLQNELLKELAPCYSESDTQHEINFEVPANIKFFEGHFPKSPILPAFAIIEISMALGRQLKILPEELKKVSNAKFLAVIKPGDNIRVLIQKKTSDFEWQQKENETWKKASEVSFD